MNTPICCVITATVVISQLDGPIQWIKEIVWMIDWLTVYLHVCLSACLSDCLSVCLSARQAIYVERGERGVTYTSTCFSWDNMQWPVIDICDHAWTNNWSTFLGSAHTSAGADHFDFNHSCKKNRSQIDAYIQTDRGANIKATWREYRYFISQTETSRYKTRSMAANTSRQRQV